MKAHCWKHVWHIPGCWRCEAREWRRKKDQAALLDRSQRAD